MLKDIRSILIGVGMALLIISAGLSFLTHGCPKIYRIPPNEPNLLFGSFTNKP